MCNHASYLASLQVYNRQGQLNITPKGKSWSHLQGSRIHILEYQGGINNFRRKLKKVAFECHNLIRWKLVLHFFCTLISSAEITSHLRQRFFQSLTLVALLHPNSNIPRPLSFSSTSIHTYSLICRQSLSLTAHNHMNIVPIHFWLIQRTQVFASAKSSLQSKGSKI